ncbi:PD-(D/E)XK nuclease-like domain-containing protein [Algivirga pacifica]|uniref:Putative exodeoxyribonuclease 8 PDDEXK-like domain-containing protein n=1 Tax=Algivirga pacifica TaxID=1162670 RepID=A0ABP9CWM2_9BACT
MIIHEQMPEEEYRAHPAISNTDLSLFKDLLTGRIRYRRSQALRMGSAIHMAILEPDRWPAYRHKFAPNDLRRIEKVTKAALRNEELQAMVQDEEVKKEVSMFWTDADTGIECKARADLYLEGAFIGDLKSTSARQLDHFLADAHRYEYNRQLAFYCSGAGVKEARLIGVSKNNMGRVFTAAYSMEGDFMKAGIQMYKALLRQLQEREDLQEQFQQLKKG